MTTREPTSPRDDADETDETEAPEAATQAPEVAAPEEPAPDARCEPHGNRPPCPRCLADEYGVQVWNSI